MTSRMVVVGLCALLSACGSKQSEQGKTTTAPAAETTDPAIDSILRDVAPMAAELPDLNPQPRAEMEARLIADTIKRIRAAGVDDPALKVYFTDGYAELRADYTRRAADGTAHRFTASAKIPRARDL